MPIFSVWLQRDVTLDPPERHLPQPRNNGFYTAIDAGSTKVCAVVSRAGTHGIDIVGHGVAPLATLAPDLDGTTSAIREAVAQAARRSRLRIAAVYASSLHSPARVLGFGATAACSVAERETLLQAVERAGLSVIDFVPSTVGSAECSLRADERDLGSAVLDVGASATGLAIYRAGSLASTHVIDFGGAAITSEIAARFEISVAEAEFLKRNVGIASSSLLDGDQLVAVPNCSRGAGKALRRRELAQTIEARLDSLWDSVTRCLAAQDLPAGVTLTGGTTLLHGFPALAELRLERPVRRAAPFGLPGLPGQLHSPCFATAVGLAVYVARHADALGQRSMDWGRRRLATA